MCRFQAPQHLPPEMLLCTRSLCAVAVFLDDPTFVIALLLCSPLCNGYGFRQDLQRHIDTECFSVVF